MQITFIPFLEPTELWWLLCLLLVPNHLSKRSKTVEHSREDMEWMLVVPLIFTFHTSAPILYPALLEAEVGIRAGKRTRALASVTGSRKLLLTFCVLPAGHRRHTDSVSLSNRPPWIWVQTSTGHVLHSAGGQLLRENHCFGCHSNINLDGTGRGFLLLRLTGQRSLVVITPPSDLWIPQTGGCFYSKKQNHNSVSIKVYLEY